MSKEKKKDFDYTYDVPSDKKDSTVFITFKGNRKIDLHVGRQSITFRGRERKSIPASWLTHPDFKCMANQFIISKGGV